MRLFIAGLMLFIAGNSCAETIHEHNVHVSDLVFVAYEKCELDYRDKSVQKFPDVITLQSDYEITLDDFKRFDAEIAAEGQIEFCRKSAIFLAKEMKD